MQPLSRPQQKAILSLARQAWERWARDEWTGGINAGTPEATLFRAWRQQEQHAACRQHSLTTCTRADYSPLIAHFARLSGNDTLERAHTAKLAEDPRNTALAVLERNCQQRDLLFPDYPAAIARRQYKCSLHACTPKQLWSLVYTIRNRRKPTEKKSASKDGAA